MGKKVLVLLTDGVGIRNFTQTEFPKEAENQGLEIIWWNTTALPIPNFSNFMELDVHNTAVHKLIPYHTRARKRLELNAWKNKFNDPVYLSYKFPFAYKGMKNFLGSLYTQYLILKYSGKQGILKVRKKIEELERDTEYYKSCLEQLKDQKPDVVYSTTQRATKAIAPLLAARELGITTVSFIYSWDNVPKAMLLTETDYYFVWSKLMKDQLLKYYDWINSDQVMITGTPQFEPHYKQNKILNRTDFFRKYNLDLEKKYICFSGDDITTSPLDHLYLKDLAIAVQKLNIEGFNLGIIFRKAPVDYSGRYKQVIKGFRDVITEIQPLWEVHGKIWSQHLPLKEDFYLLSNICEHSEMVVNICSSMVFDFAIHDKTCIYINYEQPELKKGTRDIGQNYKYVHFRSMPSENPVIWVESPNQFVGAIKSVFKNKFQTNKEVKKWFEIVAGENPGNSSKNISRSLKRLACI